MELAISTTLVREADYKMTRTALSLFLLVCPALASANLMTMTFDGVPIFPIGDSNSYSENGVTAHGRVASGAEAGTAYVVQGAASPYGGPLDFTTGGLFTPVSVMIDPLRSGYCATGECGELGADEPIPYIWISGFLNGLIIGEFGFYEPAATSWSTLSLDFLGEIDTLRIRSKYVGIEDPAAVCFASGCGSFNIDNLRVESVPEPEMFALLLLGGLAAYVSRRRRVA